MIESFISFLAGLTGTHVYWIVFGTLLACGMGLPVPEDITLIASGYLAESGIIDPLWVGLVCLVGVLSGDAILFGLGRRYGEDVLDVRLFRRAFSKKRMERATYYFERYGRKVVFLGRFVAGARAPIFLIAGILKMPARTFFLLDGLAALISVPLLIWLGHTFADNLEGVVKMVRHSQHLLLIILIVALAALLIYQLYTTVERAASEAAVRGYEKAHPEADPAAHILPTEVPGMERSRDEGRKGGVSKIYKAYDIRGRVPEELDEDLARRIGWAIGTQLGVPEIVVGRDVRTSSPRIARALCAGLGQAGTAVCELGLATTPLTNFAVGLRGLGGGVMVTASHNPPEYNGFKISRAGAVPVYDEEIRRIGKLAGQAPPPAGESPPRGTPLDVRAEFIDQIVKRARRDGRRLKVVADLSSGAATTLSPQVFERLPHDFVLLNSEPDGSFPSHPPDPLKEENLDQARRVIRAEQADLGAVYDGDADRIVFLDETGRTVTGDLATLLIALGLIAASGEDKPVVFYDVRCSRVVPECVREAGGDPRRTRVGHAFMKTAMRKAGGLCGGELSGHYYFRDNFNAENSDLALVLVLNRLTGSDKPFSQVVAPYRRYYHSGEISLEVSDKAGALEKLARRFVDGQHSRLDGLTVDYPDWWFNVRPSNTEPLLRVNVESTKSAQEMERRRDEIVGIVSP